MKKILFISSTGGHLTELLQLSPLFSEYDYHIITEKTKSNMNLYNKYGKDHVSGIITFGTLKSKQAIRDVGRILNIKNSDIDYLCKRLSMNESLKDLRKRSMEISNFIDGDDKLMDLSHEARLDWILYETQKRLEMELSTDKAVDNDIKARANLAIQKITELRNEIAGYYKDDSDKDVQFEFFD